MTAQTTARTDATAAHAQAAPSASPAARLLIALLCGYQTWFSPLFAAMGARCCFEPSCSQYALDAVQARGPLRGLALALWRLLRCNPFHAGGYDPVTAVNSGGEATEDAGRRRMRCFT